jgi:hypothetical protein
MTAQCGGILHGAARIAAVLDGIRTSGFQQVRRTYLVNLRA